MTSDARKSVAAAAAAAAVGCTAFVQTAGNNGATSAPVLRGAQQAHAVPGDASRSSVASISILSLGAAGAALLSKRAKGSNVPAGSAGKFSPGYNTLPEWEKPKNGFEGLVGDQPPLGFWDPAGYAKDGNVENFKRRREVELKHGRVAMFATIGYIVPEYFKFEGYCAPSEDLKFADIPNGLKALSVVPAAGWAQILAFAGFIELAVNKPTGEPGNYGKGYLSLGTLGFGGSIQDPEVRVKKLAIEISNGRLAMFAIIGMFFQDGLTGSSWGDWALYTDSPLRAFENELGVQPPVGFWDPVGFTKDGSAENFKRRRSVELKHGRIAMLATMGYITPEVAGKFGGLCATDLEFTAIPNGLAALDAVPFLGWVQIFAYCGAIEYSAGLGEDAWGQSKAPGDMGWKPPFFTGGTEEQKNRRLAVELANGRLAMMAIIGMFFQDGLTGSAWGDWANYTDSPLRAFENELGVQAPVGYFDPMGMSKDGDAEVFYRRRCTEIKNGRVAMIATMGYIAPEFSRFPGYCSPTDAVKFADIPNGLAALGKVPAGGLGQWIAFCGFLELYAAKQDQADPPGLLSGKNEGFGRVEFGRLGIFRGDRSPDDAAKKRGLDAELANGRLAMMAITGMFFQDGLTGSAWGDWANYTDSPLRAFENELGVQAPVGYFDPLGFTKDGDEAKFKRRRQVELKNGRVAMWATLGYIVPEYVRFPGDLSPSAGLKFIDMPSGLEAMQKVPVAGGMQMFLFAGFLEWGLFKQDGNRAPGDFENVGDLGIPYSEGVADPEDRKRKLNVELANGRLAMFAIMGMMFQNGFIGSSGPDMWSPAA